MTYFALGLNGLPSSLSVAFKDLTSKVEILLGSKVGEINFVFSYRKKTCVLFVENIVRCVFERELEK